MAKRKSRKWWVHFPNQVYANDIEFEHPVDVEEAKEWIRNWIKVKRLPRYTQVWPG